MVKDGSDWWRRLVVVSKDNNRKLIEVGSGQYRWLNRVGGSQRRWPKMVTVGNTDRRCTFNNNNRPKRGQKHGQLWSENEGQLWPKIRPIILRATWPDFLFFPTESTTKEQTSLEYVWQNLKNMHSTRDFLLKIL